MAPTPEQNNLIEDLIGAAHVKVEELRGHAHHIFEGMNPEAGVAFESDLLPGKKMEIYVGIREAEAPKGAMDGTACPWQFLRTVPGVGTQGSRDNVKWFDIDPDTFEAITLTEEK